MSKEIKDYRYEKYRLESFKNWNVSYLDPHKLAAAGFYYTGINDNVKCFECGVEICKWEKDDSIFTFHRKWSPKCKFLNNLLYGNVPIGVDISSITYQPSKDVCGIYYHEFCDDNTSYDGVVTHPVYADYSKRLKSFKTWPISMRQSKEHLAEAGFYYLGISDITTCYHCGVEIKTWELNDDPWEEHIKWSYKCYHILIVKGQEYINNIKRKFKSINF